jgi:hypothetical protein
MLVCKYLTMKPNPAFRALVLALLPALVAAAAATALGAVLRADVIEQVLVKVNGEIFTKTDLEARQVDAPLAPKSIPRAVSATRS